jgi:hypothetical protein
MGPVRHHGIEVVAVIELTFELGQRAIGVARHRTVPVMTHTIQRKYGPISINCLVLGAMAPARSARPANGAEEESIFPLAGIT